VFNNGAGKQKTIIEMQYDENTYLVLALRYKELFGEGGSGGEGDPDIPFEIDGYLTQIDTGKIDTDYMNSRFDKYLKMIVQEGVDEDQKSQILDDVHKSFAYLTRDEQKYANIFLHEVQGGYAVMESGKAFREYITEYQCKAKNDQISRITQLLGLDEDKLRDLMDSGVTEANINQFGRFDELKNTVDKAKAKKYFESLDGSRISPFKINIKTHELLQRFITSGGFEI
jgi:type I restriction enzyme R subunit